MDSETDDPTVRLDDASDRVAVLAGRVIDQAGRNQPLEEDDVDDLQAAAETVLELVDEIEAP